METDQLRIEYLPLATIQKAPRNPKQHDLGILHRSLGRFGFVAPILLDERTGRLVAGHGRVDTLVQMRDLGQPPPERIVARDGDWFVPVIRGVTFRDGTEAEAYLIADNRTVELGGWDDAVLVESLQALAAGGDGLLDGIGYEADDLDALIAGLAAPLPDAPAPELDRAEALCQQWGVERGQ